MRPELADLLMVLEFNGKRLMSQVVPGGAATLKFDDAELHPQHQAVPGEWIEWPDIPGLVLRYERRD